ncbi:MAG: hypothetical protein IJ115_01620, partial [Erysipelotrichaceae bacterium]|nr:hypothetical protein [Erysipelotrichaceae bacterium]
MTVTIRIRKTLKGELNGRLLLFLDKPDSVSEEKQLYKRRGLDGAEVVGVTFYGLHGGDEIVFDEQKEHMFGFPLQYDEIPHERLQVQAFFIRYHKYTRKDGKVIYGMADNDGGGNYAQTPYNLYSKVETVN